MPGENTLARQKRQKCGEVEHQARQKALDYKLGARGLRSLCEAILTNAMFDLPTSEKGAKKQLVIDRAYAEEQLEGSRIGRLKAA